MNKNKKSYNIVWFICGYIIFFLFKSINENKDIHKIKVHTDKGIKWTLEIPKTDSDYKIFTYYFEYDVTLEHCE